ncbi:MAG: MFS transporter, partial [Actinomycetota bacterium]
AVFGISIGNLLMLQPLLLAEGFGVKNYGRIYSFNQLFGTIGVAGGPLALGVLRDLYDYEIAFFVAAGASFAGFVFMVLAGSTKRVQQLWQ